MQLHGQMPCKLKDLEGKEKYRQETIPASPDATNCGGYAPVAAPAEDTVPTAHEDPHERGNREFPVPSIDQQKAMNLNKSLVFPGVLFLCNVASAIACLAAGDWRRAVYWAASSACIASVSL
jgi:hypothetical protein